MVITCPAPDRRAPSQALRPFRLTAAGLVLLCGAGGVGCTSSDESDATGPDQSSATATNADDGAVGVGDTSAAEGATSLTTDVPTEQAVIADQRAPVERRSPDCVFSKAEQPLVVAFCDSFDEPTRDPATRSGDLDATVWGVSRTNTFVNMGQGQYNDWLPATLKGCGSSDEKVSPPDDVRICDGRLHDAVTDGGGQPTLAMYPKQPLDIAGRTGTAVFDVGADSQGPHAAWPEFWWTDQPVPAPHGSLASQAPYAQNSFGFSLASDQCGTNGTTVDRMMVTREYALEEVQFTQTGCISKGSSTGDLNHFEVLISETRVEVWASDPGSTDIHQIAYADVEMPMTRGVIWIEDVRYNACKSDTQCEHTFAWDNVGFDGPTPYRDLTFDVQDASPTQLGYVVHEEPTDLVAPGVYWLQEPTKSFVGLNWFPYEALVPSVRVNEGAWHDTPWPFADDETFVWRTLAIPIPFEEIRDGDNTIEVKYAGGDGTVVANVNIILIAASPVP
jgi:hypothetical protein